LQIEKASLEKKGEKITPEKEAELFKTIKDRYDNQVSPYYAAARIWTDAIIDPLDTRKWVSTGIEAANHALSIFLRYIDWAFQNYSRLCI